MTANNLLAKDGARIAYHARPGNLPGVMFLGGFKSDMQGNKARALDQWCAENNRQFTRFDYFGHGESDGEFCDGTIGRWLEDTLQVMDTIAEGPQVLIGSSMGGWMMLLAALARPARVAGLLGIAAAADFTERLIWQRLDQETRELLEINGSISRPSAYMDDPFVISHQLVVEGRQHLLLENDIKIECPVRLIHSLDDLDVPWQTSLDMTNRISGDDVKLHLLKDAGHRLSRDSDIALILSTLSELLMSIEDTAAPNH